MLERRSSAAAADEIGHRRRDRSRLESNPLLALMERDSKHRAFTRAPRYTIRIPLRYRSSGEQRWRDGDTENISRSGVLFRTEDPMPPQTTIEILLALPAELAGNGAAATVLCRGRVVRTEAAGQSNGDVRPAVAATIAGYRLAHVQGNDPRRI